MRVTELFIIVRRELLERVRAKSFLIGTLLFPLLTGALIILPTMVSGGGRTRSLVLVDEAPPGVGDRFIESISARADTGSDNRYRVIRASGSLAGLRADLNRRVLNEEIDGYVAFPPGVLETSEVIYRARSISSLSVMRDLRRAASGAVQAERLRRAGLEGAGIPSLIRPVEVQGARITKRGEEVGSALSTFFFAYVITFLIYFMTVMYGVNVMRSVLEEKTNRIAEVLVSSVRPSHLMAGKILGVGSAAVLQVLIWAAIVIVALKSGVLGTRFQVPPETLNALRVDPWVGISLFLFFILGFFLYASLFAALGASVTTDQEAQSMQTVVLLPLIVPLLFLGAITNDPLGASSTWLGLIPYTAPIAMPMRMASGPIPIVQVFAAMALLVLALVFTAWVAGKIYRVGILSTGKKPTLKELGRWLRAA
jgi:ABC-2 type transport system permease protein